jgi:hypothetical protein
VPGVRFPAKNLALLGQRPGQFMLKKTSLAALGLLCPVLVSVPWIIAGISLPFYVPGAAGLLLAALLFVIPDLAVRDQAKRAREEFVHTLSAYLDLVALKRAADAGPSESPPLPHPRPRRRPPPQSAVSAAVRVVPGRRHGMARDVVGLYLDSPEWALVLCADKKSQIQALDRSQPVLPMMPGVPERRSHGYVRAGTTTLRRPGSGQ